MLSDATPQVNARTEAHQPPHRGRSSRCVPAFARLIRHAAPACPPACLVRSSSELAFWPGSPFLPVSPLLPVEYPHGPARLVHAVSARPLGHCRLQHGTAAASRRGSCHRHLRRSPRPSAARAPPRREQPAADPAFGARLRLARAAPAVRPRHLPVSATPRATTTCGRTSRATQALSCCTTRRCTRRAPSNCSPGGARRTTRRSFASATRTRPRGSRISWPTALAARSSISGRCSAS